MPDTEVVNDSDIDSMLGEARGVVADANKAPAAVPASMSSPLTGQAGQQQMQGGATGGATPNLPEAPSVQPALQSPQFTAPAIQPSSIMQAGKQQNAAHPIAAPQIAMPSSNLPQMKPVAETPSTPWYQQILGHNPMQNAGRGALAGLIGGVDTLDTLSHAVGQPIAGMLGTKMEPPINAQKEFEKTLPEGTTDEPGYKAGKTGTELAGYVAQGVVAPAVSTPAMLAEGAMWSGVSSAKDQMAATGKIDPMQTVGDAAIGAGISAATIGAGKYIGKKWRGAKYEAAKDRLKGITGKTEEGLGSGANKSLKGAFGKVADEIETQYEKELARLDAIIGNNEGATTLQRSQQDALKKWEAKQLPKAEAAKGAYRHPKFGKGFEIIEHADPIESLEKHLGAEHHATLKEAVAAMGFAKSWVMLLQNDREAFAKNAMSLAKTAAQKAKIEPKEKSELTSAAKETLAKAKSKLHLEQQQHIKGQMKAQRDKLIDEIKTAPRKAKVALRRQLAEVNKALEEDSLPEILKVPQEKHLYGIADRAAFEEQEKGRDLAKNFDDAFSQFKKADTTLKAAEEQYEKLSKDLLPIFAHAEEKMQKETGELKRIFVRYDLSHPFQRSVTTPFAVGTQFKGSTATLTGLFAKRYAGIVKEIHAQQENFIKERIYQVGQLVDELEQMHLSKEQKEKALRELGAKYETSKELAQAMAKSGSLHPGVQKLLLLAGLGMVSADLPSTAYDGHKESGGSHPAVYIGGILIAASLCSRIGVASAYKLTKSRLFNICTNYANTRTLAGGADKVLNAAKQLDLTTRPELSLQYKLNELGGNIMMAINTCPDDAEYLHKAVFDKKGFEEMEKATGKKLSPLAKKYATEIQRLGKEFRGFITKYKQAWDAHIQSLPEKDKSALQELTDTIRFIDGFMQPEVDRSDIDRFLREQMSRSSKAIFYANPKQAILNMVANVAINGPLQVGPGAVAAAFKGYSSNKILRGLINQVVHGGSQSQYIQELSAKAKPLATESQASRFMTLASFAHYFDEHPNQMKQLRIRNWEDFAIKALQNRLPEQTALDAYIQLYVDITETLGGDPLKLVMGPFSRSNAAHFTKYFADIERYKALVLINWNKRNYKWLGASLLMLQQFGGHSVLPVELQMAGLAFNASGMAALFAFLDNWSLIGHITGDMSHSLGWSMIIPSPAMGQVMPGVSNILDTMNGLEDGASNLPEVFHAIANGGLMGDPANEANEKAQKSFRSVINAIAQIYPTVQDIPFLKSAPAVPLESLAAVMYNLPKFMHNEMTVGVPNPVALGTGAHPFEATKVVHAPKMFGPLSTAQWESLRAMARLGSGIDATEYKDYGIGKHLNKKNPEMKQQQAATGIH